MKRKLRKKLSGLLAVVFLLCAAAVIGRLLQYRQADQIYEAAQQLAMPPSQVSSVPAVSPLPAPSARPVPSSEPATELPDAPVPLAPTPEESDPVEDAAALLADLDLDALRQVNDRVLGWICIPDSPINYPLLTVTDNEEYLYRAWDGTENKAGSIFLECRNDPALTDFNTLIYGHRMGNGSMFGMLSRYAEQEYRDAHPYVYLVTDEAVFCYEVFSAYEAAVTDHAFRLVFADAGEKQSAIGRYLTDSVLAPGTVPGTEDRILTLATCTGTGLYHSRWVVQAVLSRTIPRT